MEVMIEMMMAFSIVEMRVQGIFEAWSLQPCEPCDASVKLMRSGIGTWNAAVDFEAAVLGCGSAVVDDVALSS